MMLRTCCCCGLRHGALAVCIVFLSLSVLELLGVLIGWGAADAEGADYYRRARNDQRYDRWIEYQVPYAEALAPCTILVLVQLVFDVLLLRGISISSTQVGPARRYIVAWMIFRAALFAIISLGTIGLLVVAIITRYTIMGKTVSVVFGGSFVLTAIISGFFWYSWVVVLSFYWQLRTTETGVTYNMIELRTTPVGTQEDARQPAPLGEASAPEVAGAGQTNGQKWAGAGQTNGQKWAGAGQTSDLKCAGAGQTSDQKWAGAGQTSDQKWAGAGQTSDLKWD